MITILFKDNDVYICIHHYYMTEKTFKILVNNRDYTSYEILDANTFEKVELDIVQPHMIDIIQHTIDKVQHIVVPFNSKLFTEDIFTIDENNQVNIVHSSIRSGPAIPAVLILHGDKTYGRDNKKQSNKLLYKCVPDDIRLPTFLVPYEMKHIGFSKVIQNMYVTIIFTDWTANDKHPKAKLDNVIGPVNVLDNFYEYQLYCKSLNASIKKFNNDTTKSIGTTSSDKIIETMHKKHIDIEDRTDPKIWHVITIDPLNSKDFDDAVSIRKMSENTQILSIYISNVALWMDTLNLWESFSRRISTIYLPDKKKPMLPTILSDDLCSLQEKVKRVVFVMDVHIKDNIIENITFCNAVIKVHKNYVYEEPRLLSSHKYHEILEAVSSLSTKYKYINNIRDSHDLVCYLMIFMNFQCATHLIKHKTGIFRSTIFKPKSNIVPPELPEEVSKFIKIWNSSSGQYVDGSKIVDTRHELLDLDAYIHITSPIRRLVDLLNIIKFQQTFNPLSENADKFYDKWLNELDYINTTMRSIKKVQNDCSLLDLCHNNPAVLEKEYDGYLFDKITKNNGLFQYIVFLPDLKMSSRITSREDYANYTNKHFKLFVFNNEEKFKRKIRLHIIF